MKGPKTIRLKNDERIVAIVPELSAGPGWVNTPVWVYVVNSSKEYRCECIQPEEQTPSMRAIFDVCSAAYRALEKAVPVTYTRVRTSSKASSKIPESIITLV